MTAWETWAAGVLAGLGAPNNQTNIDTLFAWSSAETDPFPLMRWDNPLDTTQPEGAGNVDENSVGVKAYPTVEQGIQATVITLLNGHYPTIVSHLRNSVPRQQWGDACRELGVWGTGCAWISRDYGMAPSFAGEDVNPNLLADLMYLAGLGRVPVGNEADWLVKVIQSNPTDFVGSTLGAVVNSEEGKAWAAKLAELRNGLPAGPAGPAGPPGPAGKDAPQIPAPPAGVLAWLQAVLNFFSGK